MQYNELSQEIERILPGNVIGKWQYDATGRPTKHRISASFLGSIPSVGDIAKKAVKSTAKKAKKAASSAKKKGKKKAKKAKKKLERPRTTCLKVN